MTSLFVLMMFAVNHVIDEWRHSVACVNTEGRDILNIAYDCYSQNDNVIMAAL